MLKHCGKCRSRKHYYTYLIKVRGKKYWIDLCAVCKTPMSMDAKDKEDETSS